MASVEERLKAVEDALRRLRDRTSGSIVVGGSLQQTPADATLALPHMDTWLFEDNVDATHPANLRYVVASVTRQIVSARLSIKMSPYRTYNNFSATATGAETGHTHSHVHTSAGHAHTIPIDSGASATGIFWGGSGTNLNWSGGGGVTLHTAAIDSTTPGNTGNNATGSSGHTHPISVTSFLGVTEGATATGVTIGFDGVDHTADLGGPFNADVVELDVRRFLATATGVWHVIAMQPSGLGRIEAHLRLGVYVAAGQVA